MLCYLVMWPLKKEIFCYFYQKHRQPIRPRSVVLRRAGKHLSSGFVHDATASSPSPRPSWSSPEQSSAADELFPAPRPAAAACRSSLPNLHATQQRQRQQQQHPFNGPFAGLPGWVSTRKVKPIWILAKQETVNGSGISWVICKSAPRFRQITTPASHHPPCYTKRVKVSGYLTMPYRWRLAYGPLALTVSCFSKIQIGVYLSGTGSPG